MNSTPKNLLRNSLLFALLFTPTMLFPQSVPAFYPPADISGGRCGTRVDSMASRQARQQLMWTFTPSRFAVQDSSCQMFGGNDLSLLTAWQIGDSVSLHDLPLGPKAPIADLGDAGNETDLLSAPRKMVLAILREDNACSAWFRRFDSQVVSTFSSLHYQIEMTPERHVIRKKLSSGGWVEYGPYIARVMEYAGPGATVTINADGAFFRDHGDVYMLDWPRTVFIVTGDRRVIHVGPYLGGTLRAQTITLLHELAHVVGAISEDNSAIFGPGRSQENTDIVLERCKRTVDAAAHNANLASNHR
jgi:hypothetical protein